MRAIASGRAAIIAITFVGTLLADYRFVTVDYPGRYAELMAINGGGQIVGDVPDPSAKTQVVFFADTNGRIGLSFQYPGVTYTHSSGIDSAGNVIGQYVDFANGESGYVFLRSATGPFSVLTLPILLPPVFAFPSGQAISGNGAIVLSASNNKNLFFRAA